MRKRRSGRTPACRRRGLALSSHAVRLVADADASDEHDQTPTSSYEPDPRMFSMRIWMNRMSARTAAVVSRTPYAHRWIEMGSTEGASSRVAPRVGPPERLSAASDDATEGTVTLGSGECLGDVAG
jgi:hypothetical protein